jgi:hypothetical protein
MDADYNGKDSNIVFAKAKLLSFLPAFRLTNFHVGNGHVRHLFTLLPFGHVSSNIFRKYSFFHYFRKFPRLLFRPVVFSMARRTQHKKVFSNLFVGTSFLQGPFKSTGYKGTTGHFAFVRFPIFQLQPFMNGRVTEVCIVTARLLFPTLRNSVTFIRAVFSVPLSNRFCPSFKYLTARFALDMKFH